MQVGRGARRNRDTQSQRVAVGKMQNWSHVQSLESTFRVCTVQAAANVQKRRRIVRALGMCPGGILRSE